MARRNAIPLKASDIILARHLFHPAAKLKLEESGKNLGRTQLTFQRFYQFVELRGRIPLQLVQHQPLVLG